MANWEGSRNRPRTSSRFAPGIYVNVDFGWAFSASDRTHTTSMNYTSRNMQERLYRQQEEAYYRDREQAFALSQNDYEVQRQTRDYQQERQRRLGVRPLEQHERGSSAPPTLSERDEPISPLSLQQTPIEYRPVQHTSSFPQDLIDRPLPYSPARFRLGEDDLPWSVPPWYRPPEPEFASPTLPRAPPARKSPPQALPPRVAVPREIPSIGPEIETRRVETRWSPNRGREPKRVEDPQRVRDLGELHQAMMTVDTLNHDGWESRTWEDGVESMATGPRSLGWAVSTDPSPIDGGSLVPPPPYIASQWERVVGKIATRPRSSG